jgi:hypothetical protein
MSVFGRGCTEGRAVGRVRDKIEATEEAEKSCAG